MTQEEYNYKRDEIVEEFIDYLSNDDLVALWNEHCYANNCVDDVIERNTEEAWYYQYNDKTPYQMMIELSGTQCNSCDDYVVFGVYGPTTFSNPKCEDSPLCVGEIDYGNMLDYARKACLNYTDLEDELDELESEFERSQAKEQFAKDWDEMCRKHCPMFEFPNGEYLYISYDPDEETLQTGSACNAGFCMSQYSVTMDVDYDFSLDENIQSLYDEQTNKFPELLNDTESNENN